MIQKLIEKLNKKRLERTNFFCNCDGGPDC